MVNLLYKKSLLNMEVKLIAYIGISFILLIAPIYSTKINILSVREPEFQKVTKITLLDENMVQIETCYEFTLKAIGDDIPFSNVWSDAINTEGELNNIVCKLNEHDFPWKMQLVSDYFNWKYIGAYGEKNIEIGRKNIFYFSYNINTSDLYNNEGIIGFKIAFSTPKSSKEIPFDFDVGVCSNSEEWIPFNPYPDSYIDKEKNCEVHESSSTTIVEGGEFTAIKKIQFQRRDLIKIVEWNQYIKISPKGEIIQEFDYSAEISVPRLIFEIPIYSGGIDPLIDVTVTLLDGNTRTVMRYETLDDLLDAVDDGGFGWTLNEFTDESLFSVALNDLNIKKLELHFKAVFPHYKLWEKINLYTYQIEYIPLFDHINPETKIRVIFEVSDNFYIEKCESQPTIWENPRIVYFDFKSGDNPFDPLIFIYSENQKKSLNIMRIINIIAIICSLIFPILLWKKIGINSIFKKLNKKIPQFMFFLITLSLNILISLISEVNITGFILHSYLIFTVPIVIFSVFFWESLAHKKKKKKKKK